MCLLHKNSCPYLCFITGSLVCKAELQKCFPELIPPQSVTARMSLSFFHTYANSKNGFHLTINTKRHMIYIIVLHVSFTISSSYTNCTTSFLISSISSGVNSGKNVGISSTDSLPFFIIVIAVFLATL